MKLLITGGLGFIGSSFLTYLQRHTGSEKEMEIHVLNHLCTETSRNNFVKWLPLLKQRLHVIDMKDYQAVLRVVRDQQFDVIVHLAAKAGVRESTSHPHVYCHSNIEGTLNLLEAVRHTSPHTRCIMASSSTVHGNPVRSFYGLTKKIVEDMSELYCRLYHLNVACLRFFSVYGTDCRKDLLIGQIMSCFQEKKPLTIFGNGDIRRDFTYIDDTLEAIYQAMTKPWTGYLVADIGTGENHSVTDVIHTVHTLLPPHTSPLEVVHVGEYKEDMNTSRASTDVAQKELQFRTHVSLKEGLRRCLSDPHLLS